MKKLKRLDFDELKINNEDSSEIFIKVVATDNNEYQVKFNSNSHRSNSKEFISYKLAKVLNIPLPEGICIQIPDEVLNEVETIYKNRGMDKLIRNRDGLYFASKWENKMKFSNFQKFYKLFEKINNKDDFFGIFLFDLYLRNDDRTLVNNLIIKRNTNGDFFYLAIDFGMIFDDLGFDRINEVIDNYNCFNQSIYEIPYKEDIEKLKLHANKYDNTIDINLIENILNNLKDIFNIDYNDIINIKNFLTIRKSNIAKACNNNIDSNCFKNIKKEL